MVHKRKVYKAYGMLGNRVIMQSPQYMSKELLIKQQINWWKMYPFLKIKIKKEPMSKDLEARLKLVKKFEKTTGLKIREFVRKIYGLKKK